MCVGGVASVKTPISPKLKKNKTKKNFEVDNKYVNPNIHFLLSLQLWQIWVPPFELLFFFIDIDTRLGFWTNVREYHEETDGFALLSFVLMIYSV